MPARANHQTEFFGERSHSEVRISFDPDDFEPVNPYLDEVQDEYREAQAALQELRQRESEIKRKAEELQEITQKEDEFTRGRREILERIEEYLVLLDREGSGARETAARCGETHQRFLEHLETIRGLRPETWSRSHRREELDRALRQIEAAEDEVADSLPLIQALSGAKRGRSRQVPVAPGKGLDDADFFYWFKAGIAFTLPAMALAVLIALIALFLR